MKKIKKIFVVCLCLCTTIFGCSKSKLENDNLNEETSGKEISKITTPQASGEAGIFTARIASTNWSVQSLGNTYAFTESVPNRYSNNGNTLGLKVLASDPKTSSNTQYARTELRSGNEFAGNTSHSMHVTMDVVEKGGKVIIAQLFDKTDNDDQNVILYHDNKIYARSSGGDETYLADLPSGSFGISITVSGSGVTLTARGQSKTYSATGHTCYFKTGVYLNSTSGSASCVISSLSQT